MQGKWNFFKIDIDFYKEKIYDKNVHAHRIILLRLPNKKRRIFKRRSKMLYIGVDLGTSAVKLLLMDGNGKIMNIVSKEYPLYFPHPGWSEQKPEDWYTQSM